ncbi:hypothetical protein Bca4012_025667 [Brassica carinata]
MDEMTAEQSSDYGDDGGAVPTETTVEHVHRFLMKTPTELQIMAKSMVARIQLDLGVQHMSCCLILSTMELVISHKLICLYTGQGRMLETKEAKKRKTLWLIREALKKQQHFSHSFLT